jgi:glyoxylase I family protein
MERGPGAPITGLSHVQLSVCDVGASAEWYSNALGLEPFAEDVDGAYVALRHRGARLVIVLTARSDPATGRGPRDRLGESPAPGGESLDHLAFAVPDGDTLCAWADHLTAKGVEHAGVVPEKGNPSLQLRDPDGIAIELVAPGPTRA